MGGPHQKKVTGNGPAKTAPAKRKHHAVESSSTKRRKADGPHKGLKAAADKSHDSSSNAQQTQSSTVNSQNNLKAKKKKKKKTNATAARTITADGISSNWKALLTQELAAKGKKPKRQSSQQRERSMTERALDKVLSRQKKPSQQSKGAHAWFEEDLEDDGDMKTLELVAKDTTVSQSSEQRGLQSRSKSVSSRARLVLEASSKTETGEAELTKHLAIDCEMVGTGFQGSFSALARCSIVNSRGEVVYDTYVRPKERVTDFRTHVSGIERKHISDAPPFEDVQSKVAELTKGKTLVGHAIHHDLKALLLNHPRHLVRDTSLYKPFRAVAKNKTPSLKKLAKHLLDIDIQGAEHDSIEDARVAMALYRHASKDWEKNLALKRKGKLKPSGKAAS